MQEQNMNWFDTTLIVVIYYSYTNGCHEGIVEFCLIEVFKFWVIFWWMKESGVEEPKLGDALASQDIIQEWATN